MSPRRQIGTVALAIGLAGALGGATVAWRALRGTRAADAATAAASRERTRAESALRTLEEKIASARQRRVELGAERDRLRAAVPPAKAAAPARRSPAALANDPEQQALASKKFRAGLVLEYLSFYRVAGLSEKQIAQLEDILTEHDARGRDLQGTAREQKLSMNDPAIAVLRRQETERFTGELQALLGEEGRRQFEQFRAASADRRSVSEFAANLALTPTPLTTEQGKQLGAVFKEVNFQRRADAAAWEEVLARSGTFLSAPQAAELRAMRNARHEITFNQLQKLIEQTKK